MTPTPDPDRRSWYEPANAPRGDFPIQNLPLGVFSAPGRSPRVGVALGDAVVDVTAGVERGLFDGDDAVRRAAAVCADDALNRLFELGGEARRALRARLEELFDARADAARREAAAAMLVPMDAVTMHVPARVGDYTDFYASVFHATHVGSMFRPDNPLLPNYKWVPIAYHGRASSIVVSDTPVRRPCGQTRADDAGAPTFGPSRLLDYELEVGLFVGPGNAPGEPVPIARAGEHIAGVCLVNDWSARDIQKWEYQPLGPFLSKSFATTVSPWVVTMEALEPFRVPAFERPVDDPAPLAYLDDPDDRRRGGIDLTLEVLLESEAMRREGIEPVRVSIGSFRHMYWTPAQMLAHHASNGCNLRAGDLLASGTVSGPEPDSRGCLLERTWRGRDRIELPDGTTRAFLEDGDRVIIRGWCEREGAVRIGLGQCSGTVMPAEGD